MSDCIRENAYFDAQAAYRNRQAFLDEIRPIIKLKTFIDSLAVAWILHADGTIERQYTEEQRKLMAQVDETIAAIARHYGYEKENNG